MDQVPSLIIGNQEEKLTSKTYSFFSCFVSSNFLPSLPATVKSVHAVRENIYNLTLKILQLRHNTMWKVPECLIIMFRGLYQLMFRGCQVESPNLF